MLHTSGKALNSWVVFNRKTSPAKVTPTFDQPHVAALIVHAKFKEQYLRCGKFSALGTKTELYGKHSSILWYSSHYALTFSIVDTSIDM